MSMIYAVASIGGLAIVFGAGLGLASIVFAVETDPKVPLIRDALPGANCGGCGFAGCDALAEAICAGEAKVNACPVGGASCAEKIAEIMGVEAGEEIPTAAFVKCNGRCDVAKNKFEYVGITDCTMAANLAGGGPKGCNFGCLGLGSCAKACLFGAIKIIDGIAVVDKDLCTSCGQCVENCPKALIEIVPQEKTTRVACNSNDKGKDVKANCQVGCIGCKMCEKACEFDAVHIENNLAKVDYEKCTLCGACVKKCPTKAIIGSVENKEEEAV